MPFRFEPTQIIPGMQLERDLGLYGDLAQQCLGLPPTCVMLNFMGSNAHDLFRRRAACREDWMAFQAAFTERWPEIVGRGSRARRAVSALATGSRHGAARQWSPTMPEILFGSALIAMAAPYVRIVGDAALPMQRSPTGHVPRADLAITSSAAVTVTTRVEVVGMLDRDRRPRTMEGAKYVTSLPGRLQRYTDAGIPPPIVVFMDELVDPGLRAEAVRRVLKPVINPLLD